MDARRRWWAGFATALFLLVPLDLFTTLLSVARYGTGVEANPVVRFLLHQGLVELTLANLVVVCVAVYLFDLAVEAIRRAPATDGRLLERGVDAWVGSMLVGGVVLVANNVAVLL